MENPGPLEFSFSSKTESNNDVILPMFLAFGLKWKFFLNFYLFMYLSFKGGMMLLCDVSHRLLRTETVYDFM